MSQQDSLSSGVGGPVIVSDNTAGPHPPSNINKRTINKKTHVSTARKEEEEAENENRGRHHNAKVAYGGCAELCRGGGGGGSTVRRKAARRDRWFTAGVLCAAALLALVAAAGTGVVVYYVSTMTIEESVQRRGEAVVSGALSQLGIYRGKMIAAVENVNYHFAARTPAPWFENHSTALQALNDSFYKRWSRRIFTTNELYCFSLRVLYPGSNRTSTTNATTNVTTTAYLPLPTQDLRTQSGCTDICARPGIDPTYTSVASMAIWYDILKDGSREYVWGVGDGSGVRNNAFRLQWANTSRAPGLALQDKLYSYHTINDVVNGSWVNGSWIPPQLWTSADGNAYYYITYRRMFRYDGYSYVVLSFDTLDTWHSVIKALVFESSSSYASSSSSSSQLPPADDQFMLITDHQSRVLAFSGEVRDRRLANCSSTRDTSSPTYVDCNDLDGRRHAHPLVSGLFQAHGAFILADGDYVQTNVNDVGGGNREVSRSQWGMIRGERFLMVARVLMRIPHHTTNKALIGVFCISERVALSELQQRAIITVVVTSVVVAFCAGVLIAIGFASMRQMQRTVNAAAQLAQYVARYDIEGAERALGYYQQQKQQLQQQGGGMVVGGSKKKTSYSPSPHEKGNAGGLLSIGNAQLEAEFVSIIANLKAYQPFLPRSLLRQTTLSSSSSFADAAARDRDRNGEEVYDDPNRGSATTTTDTMKLEEEEKDDDDGHRRSRGRKSKKQYRHHRRGVSRGAAGGRHDGDGGHDVTNNNNEPFHCAADDSSEATMTTTGAIHHRPSDPSRQHRHRHRHHPQKRRHHPHHHNNHSDDDDDVSSLSSDTESSTTVSSSSASEGADVHIIKNTSSNNKETSCFNEPPFQQPHHRDSDDTDTDNKKKKDLQHHQQQHQQPRPSTSVSSTGTGHATATTTTTTASSSEEVGGSHSTDPTAAVVMTTSISSSAHAPPPMPPAASATAAGGGAAEGAAGVAAGAASISQRQFQQQQQQLQLLSAGHRFKRVRGTVMVIRLTNLSTAAAPSATTAVQAFLNVAMPLVEQCGGVVDHLEATRLIVTFHYHLPCPKHEAAAARCAVLIQREIAHQAASPSTSTSTNNNNAAAANSVIVIANVNGDNSSASSNILVSSSSATTTMTTTDHNSSSMGGSSSTYDQQQSDQNTSNNNNNSSIAAPSTSSTNRPVVRFITAGTSIVEVPPTASPKYNNSNNYTNYQGGNNNNNNNVYAPSSPLNPSTTTTTTTTSLATSAQQQQQQQAQQQLQQLQQRQQTAAVFAKMRVAIAIASGVNLVGTVGTTEQKSRVVAGEALDIARRMGDLQTLIHCPILVTERVAEAQSAYFAVPVDVLVPSWRLNPSGTATLTSSSVTAAAVASGGAYSLTTNTTGAGAGASDDAAAAGGAPSSVASPPPPAMAAAGGGGCGGVGVDGSSNNGWGYGADRARRVVVLELTSIKRREAPAWAAAALRGFRHLRSLALTEAAKEFRMVPTAQGRRLLHVCEKLRLQQQKAKDKGLVEKNGDGDGRGGAEADGGSEWAALRRAGFHTMQQRYERFELPWEAVEAPAAVAAAAAQFDAATTTTTTTTTMLLSESAAGVNGIMGTATVTAATVPPPTMVVTHGTAAAAAMGGDGHQHNSSSLFNNTYLSSIATTAGCGSDASTHGVEGSGTHLGSVAMARRLAAERVAADNERIAAARAAAEARFVEVYDQNNIGAGAEDDDDDDGGGGALFSIFMPAGAADDEEEAGRGAQEVTTTTTTTQNVANAAAAAAHHPQQQPHPHSVPNNTKNSPHNTTTATSAGLTTAEASTANGNGHHNHHAENSNNSTRKSFLQQQQHPSATSTRTSPPTTTTISASSPSPPPPPAFPPMTIVRDIYGHPYYQSKTLLGRGQFGEVFLAMDDTGTLVALKSFPVLPSTTTSTTTSSHTGVLSSSSHSHEQQQGGGRSGPYAALIHEVEMLAKLRHENIAAYVSCAFQSDAFVIIMEYLSAGSLRTFIQADECFSRVPTRVLVNYLRDILHGLAFLHARNYVHCDIKPDNVMLTGDGRCKLTDFGTATLVSSGAPTTTNNDNNSTLNASISEAVLAFRGVDAKMIEAQLKDEAAASSSSSDPTQQTKQAQQTQQQQVQMQTSAMVRGTPRYMAPEAANGQWTAASDIFSLGVMLMELATGQHPFRAIRGNDIVFLFKLTRGEVMDAIWGSPTSTTATTMSTCIEGNGGGSTNKSVLSHGGSQTAPNNNISNASKLPLTSSASTATSATSPNAADATSLFSFAAVADPTLREVASMCLRRDPRDRPTATEILSLLAEL